MEIRLSSTLIMVTIVSIASEIFMLPTVTLLFSNDPKILFNGPDSAGSAGFFAVYPPENN